MGRLVLVLCPLGSAHEASAAALPPSEPHPSCRARPAGTGPSGRTSLSKVVVVNRQNCCQQRINSFGLDFVNAAGAVDRFPTYAFAGSQMSYTITPPGDLHRS